MKTLEFSCKLSVSDEVAERFQDHDNSEEYHFFDESMQMLNNSLQTMGMAIYWDIYPRLIDDTDKMFNICANKSLDEIKNMKVKKYQTQAIRYYLSRHLSETNENNPYKLSGEVVIEEDTLTESCYMHHICEIFQVPCEGIIVVKTNYGSEIDIDNLSNSILLDICEEFE